MSIEPNSDRKLGYDRLISKWFWRVAMFVLFAPFVIIFFLGFLGTQMPKGWFGIWFMGSLTIAGIITTLDFMKGVKAHGPSELGCVLPLAAVTCWWGYIFLKELGFVH